MKSALIPQVRESPAKNVLTLVNALCGEQNIPRDPCSSAQNGITFPHIPQVRHQLPNGRIGYCEIFDVDCCGCESRSVE